MDPGTLGLQLASEPAHLPMDCGMLVSGLGSGLAVSTSLVLWTLVRTIGTGFHWLIQYILVA